MKLLKNTGFVVFLAVAALGIVSKNILWPIYEMFMPLIPVELKEKKNVPKLVETETAVYTSKADLKNIGWVLEIERDPFVTRKPREEIEPVEEKEEEEELDVLEEYIEEMVEDAKKPVVVEKTRVPFEKRNRLVAVMLESDDHYAVINDAIVNEGDNYEGYKVLKINPNSVELQGPDGMIKLKF